MHESPVRRAAPQHHEVDVNGSNGPLAPSTAHKPMPNQKSAASNKYSQSQSYDQVRNATD
jgi:hypothetical protein